MGYISWSSANDNGSRSDFARKQAKERRKGRNVEKEGERKRKRIAGFNSPPSAIAPASLIAKNISPAFGVPTHLEFVRSHLFVGQHPRSCFKAIGWTAAKYLYGEIYEDLNGTGRGGRAVVFRKNYVTLAPFLSLRRGAMLISCGNHCTLAHALQMEMSTVKHLRSVFLSDGGSI